MTLKDLYSVQGRIKKSRYDRYECLSFIQFQDYCPQSVIQTLVAFVANTPWNLPRSRSGSPYSRSRGT